MADAEWRPEDLVRAGRHFSAADPFARRSRSRSHPLAALFSVCLTTFREIGTWRQFFGCLTLRRVEPRSSSRLASPKDLYYNNRGPLGKPWWSEKGVLELQW